MLPIYPYIIDYPHPNDGSLFHFTDAESFFMIISNLDFIISPFKNLNDLNEGNVHNMTLANKFPVMYNAHKYIQERCYALCFSQNYIINNYCEQGTNHPAMWAHYADDSKGVCIVIDKEKFIEINKKLLDNYFYKFESVEYKWMNTLHKNGINYKVEDEIEFIKSNYKHLFFLKNIDWEHEDEYRLFIMDWNENLRLNIDGCIKCIVLGNKFFKNISQIKRLLDYVVDPESLCYKKFTPHSFATTTHYNYGYRTFEIANTIFDIINSNLNDTRYYNYKEWLIKECGY